MEQFSEVLWKKFWIVLLFVILFSEAAYIGYSSWVEPEYKASANLYISNRSVDEEGEATVSYYNLLEGELILADCKSIIPSHSVLKDVAAKLNIEDYTEIKENMNVSSAGSARTVVVSYSNRDEHLAAEVLDETIVSFIQKSPEFFPNTSIYRIDTVQTSLANDLALIVVLGAACLGASMGILTIFLLWVLSKRKPAELKKI